MTQTRNKNVEVKRSELQGKGLFARRSLIAGEVIFVLEGKIQNIQEQLNSSTKIQDNSYRISMNRYLSPKGFLGDYLNHSCDPNSFMQSKNRVHKIVVVKDILVGEEIMMDYSTIISQDDIWEMFDCKCGSKNYRKLIKFFDSLPTTVKRIYRKKGMIPAHIF